MNRVAIRTFVGACVGVLITVNLAPSAEAAPSAQISVPCDGDDPTLCLNRHGELAAQSLSRGYADVASKLDGTCAEVISPGIGACLERAQQIADKALNDTYAHAMKSIDNDEAGRKWRERLKLAQQTWLRFRDADCGDLTISEWSSGTGTGAAIMTCQLGHTEARTAELNRRYGGQ